jgi:hypothetical protein
MIMMMPTSLRDVLTLMMRRETAFMVGSPVGNEQEN